MTLFEKRKGGERTVALLDIENGSVGGALAQLSRDHQPRVFGDIRQMLPIHSSPSAKKLEENVRDEIESVLLHLGSVASRLRQYEATEGVGTVERVAIFLHAPWTHMTIGEGGKVTTHSDPEFLDALRLLNRVTFDDTPLSFHAFGGAVAPLVHSLYDAGQSSLVSSISGEVTEIILVQDGKVYGQGSIPMGAHTLLRTLKTHGGFGWEEARSALKLHHPHTLEPLTFVQKEFIEDFKDVAGELLAHAPAQNVFVVGDEDVSEWFARALTHESLNDLFEEGGSVRAVPLRFLASHIAVHERNKDIPLLLAALFIDSHSSGKV